MSSVGSASIISLRLGASIAASLAMSHNTKRDLSSECLRSGGLLRPNAARQSPPLLSPRYSAFTSFAVDLLSLGELAPPVDALALLKENEMHQNRLRNTLLTVVALLLLFNLGVKLSPPAHAAGQRQYRAFRMGDVGQAQAVLDEQSAQGWEYVGSVGQTTLIFKK